MKCLFKGTHIEIWGPATFIPADDKPAYEVYPKDGECIGIIQWYTPWRQYALFPEPNTVWAGSCFRDVQRFINSLKDTKQKVKP